MSTTDVGLKPA